MRVAGRLGKTPQALGNTTNVSGSPDILQQPHNLSQQAFQRGDIKRAQSLLREEADGDRSLYQ